MPGHEDPGKTEVAPPGAAPQPTKSAAAATATPNTNDARSTAKKDNIMPDPESDDYWNCTKWADCTCRDGQGKCGCDSCGCGSITVDDLKSFIRENQDGDATRTKEQWVELKRSKETPVS